MTYGNVTVYSSTSCRPAQGQHSGIKRAGKEQAYRDKRAGRKRTGSSITYVCEGVDDVWEWNVTVYNRLPASTVNSIQGLSVQRWNVQIGIKRA